MFRFRRFILIALALATLAACRNPAERGNAEQLTGSARETITSMLADNQYPGLAPLLARAKAVLIVPNLQRTAYFVGGRGGNAVMLVKGADGKWIGPGFYTIGALSWGLQFGGADSELVIVVMTDKALHEITDQPVTLNNYCDLTVGQLGSGVGVTPEMEMGLTSDIYPFGRSAGLYVNVSLEGAVIAPRETWNQQMYGEGATAHSILVDRSAATDMPSAADLAAALP